MRRLFWMTVGATVGVYAVRKVSRIAESFTPAGVARNAGGIGESIRYFGDQVRLGMEQREAELRDALGIDNDPHEGSPEDAADLLDRPTAPRRSTRSRR